MPDLHPQRSANTLMPSMVCPSLSAQIGSIIGMLRAISQTACNKKIIATHVHRGLKFRPL